MRLTSAFALIVGLAACGGDGGVDPDATPPDASPTDADGRDSPGSFDAGTDSSQDAAIDSAVDSGVDCPVDGPGPGNETIELMHDGRMRRYHVHVPPGYDGTAPVPLVLDFHGLSSNASQQWLLSGMRDKADAEGFIAVHAEGIGLTQSWNAGACCGAAADMDVDDVGFVRAIIADVSTRVCIDPSRVYATGMSNGGFLSHRLGCEASDVIAAIAPVAGVLGIPPGDCTPSRPVPVMHFHGTADLLVPYGGSMTLGFPSVMETIDLWAERDGCTDMPESTFDMGDSHCETRDTCDGGVEVTLCTVEGGAHWWPGGLGSGSAIHATDAMWDFFSRHRLP